MDPETHDNSLPTPKRARKPKLTDNQTRFLSIYRNVGSITKAARACAMVRENHHTWMRKSELYAEAFAEAQRDAVTILEDEAHKRAVEGEREPVYYKGRIVGWKVVKSDGLLQFLLRANDPTKYGVTRIAGPDGEALIPLGMVDKIMSDAAIERDEASKSLAKSED